MDDKKLSKPVAFFDSGVGGLTVLNEALQSMPHERYIYYADSANLPYGPRTADEIARLVRQAALFLDSFRPKALVLACNTATSVVVKELRTLFDYPVIGMEPAVKPATRVSGNKKILVTATQRTLSEEKLERLISGLNAEDRIEKMPLPRLVTMAENFEFNSGKTKEYLTEVFQDIDWHMFGSLVLGCTHFIYFRQCFKDILPAHVQIIDGNSGTVNRLKSLISIEDSEYYYKPVFYESGHLSKEDRFVRFLDYLNINFG